MDGLDIDGLRFVTHVTPADASDSWVRLVPNLPSGHDLDCRVALILGHEEVKPYSTDPAACAAVKQFLRQRVHPNRDFTVAFGPLGGDSSDVEVNTWWPYEYLDGSDWRRHNGEVRVNARTEEHAVALFLLGCQQAGLLESREVAGAG